MKANPRLFEDLAQLSHLPSLPHILLKLIDLCGDENPDLGAVAEVVEKDPALTATILKLVNSAYFGLFRKVEAVSQAVILVGSSGIRNMALCACILEAFPRSKTNGLFNMKRFWWHSLRCAVLAKHIAHRLEIGSPDEAFLAGLLHDIGKAVLWINDKEGYESLLAISGHDSDLMLAGEAQIGATHAAVGAWLLDRWRLEPMTVDCVRYHHEPIERIIHALGMVQVIHLANQLCKDDDTSINAGLAAAWRLFECDSEVCRHMMAKADEEARDVAELMGIDIDAPPAGSGDVDREERKVRSRLADEVRNRSLALGILDGFLSADDRGAIVRCIMDGLHTLFDIKRSLFFMVDEKKRTLVGYVADKTGRFERQPALSITTTPETSLLADALAQNRTLDSFHPPSKEGLAIIDEQFVRLLGGRGMLCLPLAAQGEGVGVLAVGIEREDLRDFDVNHQLLNLVLHKGALALRLDMLRSRELPQIRTQRADAATELARRVVHEVNNPLGVIKNYLKVLGMKLERSGIRHDEIRIINDEISRAARLLGRLTAVSPDANPERRAVDINPLLQDIVRLSGDALMNESGIHLHTDLTDTLPPVSASPDELKQVFINLIKNAAEAMHGKGGNLTVRTKYISGPLGEKPTPPGNGGGSITVVIQDDGPGIDAALRESLFDPYTSTKTGDHAGLGLSVVYNIVKSLGGSIDCDSAPGEGTTFIIELPVV